LAGEGGFPKFTHSDTDRRDDSHPCDDDTCPHLLEILSGIDALLLNGSAGISQPRTKQAEAKTRTFRYSLNLNLSLLHVGGLFQYLD
jgi:hypothetical protein